MSDLRALIEAAKADGPSAAAKAKVWAGVSSAVGGAASVSGGGAAAGSLGAVKMLVLGTLLGGSLTVGIGAAALVVHGARPAQVARSVAAPAPATARLPAVPVLSLVRPVGPLHPAAPVHPLAPLAVAVAESNVNPLPVPIDDVLVNTTGVVNAPAAPIEFMRRAPPSRPSTATVAVDTSALGAPPLAARAASSAQDDALAREASLLASARNALARRDALTALQIVRGLSSLPSRQLVPEEMAVEAQALRGLGLAAQGDAVDATLHAKFPDSVLGR
jgi:hypothetical protein